MDVGPKHAKKAAQVGSVSTPELAATIQFAHEPDG